MKNTFHIIYVFVLLMLFVACGVQKSSVMSQVTESRSTQSKEDSVATKVVKDSSSIVASFEKDEEISAREIEIVQEEFSKPDSAGQQYLQRRVTTKIANPKSKSSERSESITEQRKEVKDSTCKQNETTDTEQYQKQKIKTKERTGVPEWIKILAATGAFSILFILYSKRKGLWNIFVILRKCFKH
jgi:hypothetical protein